MVKKFKDLNLNSAFLFAAALSDPEICREVLEIILGRTIPKVNVKSENTILLSSDAKWIRLDINARDEFNVNYNIEAQNSDDTNIAKRSRYYQAEMDVAELKPGDDYDKLPESYVIFICTFDPFGKGLYQYTFSEKCEQNGMPLGDGTHKIFLSTKGTNEDEVSPVLIHFLKYFENSTDDMVATVNDKSISRLHNRITEIKKSREWEAGYMKMTEIIERAKRNAQIEGERIGFSEGQRKGLLEGQRKGLLEGQRKGMCQSIVSFLSDIGNVPDELQKRIEAENDMTVLDKWLKLAARSDSFEAFEKNM